MKVASKWIELEAVIINVVTQIDTNAEYSLLCVFNILEKFPITRVQEFSD